MVDRILFAGRRFGRQTLRLVVFAGLFLLVRRFLAPRNLAVASEPSGQIIGEHQSAEGKQEKPATTAYEATDWPVGPVALIYVGALVLLVISCLALIAAYPSALPDVGRTLRITPPGPLLQTDSEGDLRRFRAEEEKKLSTYYWIDKQKGVVHIPIERAMQDLVKAGSPGFPRTQQ
jgi:hypothetical protein